MCGCGLKSNFASIPARSILRRCFFALARRETPRHLFLESHTVRTGAPKHGGVHRDRAGARTANSHQGITVQRPQGQTTRPSPPTRRTQSMVTASSLMPPTVIANRLPHRSGGQFIESYLLAVRALTFDKLFLSGDCSRIRLGSSRPPRASRASQPLLGCDEPRPELNLRPGLSNFILG